jgi:hypothetical protein
MLQLVNWSDGDMELLIRLNSPEMTEHLGGPESTRMLEERQTRYVAAAESETAYIWKVVLLPEGIGWAVSISGTESGKGRVFTR